MLMRDRKNYVFDINKRVTTHTDRIAIDGVALTRREGVVVGIGSEMGDQTIAVRLIGEMIVRTFLPVELDVI